MMVIGTSSFSAVVCCAVVSVVSIVSCDQNTNAGIFRHQVLPFLGGKIPESAFSPERLRINRLDKNGIYTLDGVYFEERHPERHHFPRTFMPNTIKLQIPPDNKHVAKPGKKFKPHTIDTTYLISETVKNPIRPSQLNFKDLPLLPVHSLKLSYTAKMKKLRPDYESVQIFQTYLPLLKKMHEIYRRK